jgi:class 3 adenylate cyclase
MAYYETMPLSWRGPFVAFFAFAALSQSALGLALTKSAARIASARQMMLALCVGSAGLAWLGFVNASPAVRAALHPPWVAVVADAFFAGCGGYSAGMFARVFAWFPRTLTEDEWVQYRVQHRKQGDRRRRTFQRDFRVITDTRTPWVCALLMGSVPVVGYLRFVVFGDYAHAGLLPPFARFLQQATGVIATVPWMVIPIVTAVAARSALLIQAESASGQQRRQYSWIVGSLAAANIVVIALLMAFAALVGLDLVFGGFGLFDAGIVAQLGVQLPFTLPMLYVYVLLAGIAVSIFYHGTVDPKLAIGKISAWSVLVIALTFVFLLMERFLARWMVGLFGWSPDTGGVVAGAVTAAVFGPLRNRTQHAVQLLADRWLPNRAMDGERVMRTICFTDISGFASVSARDEPRALLLAAILLRQARAIAARHDGRVVKSLGDAVIWEFEDAANAIGAVDEMTTAFANACAVAGVEPLPLHSGIHTGEVTLTPQGDVFGVTVNLASRLQDHAKAGETVVSQQTLDAAALDAARVTAAGSHSFKNIPEPTACFRVSPAVSASS